MPPFVSTKAFKETLRRGAPGKSAPAAGSDLGTLRKAFMSKAEDAGNRQIKFTISTNAVDLDNDTVDQSGWDLSVYLTNPLVLWMHDNSSLPVGKCIGIGVEDGALKATVEFIPAEINVFADTVYQLILGGFLSATSVGFLPISFEIAADRSDENSWWPAVNFTKQKLLEFSIVTVPANSEALVEPGQRSDAALVTTDPEPDAPALDDQVTQAAAAALEAKAALDAVFARHKQIARIL